MAETLTIRTASSTEIVKIAVPGPQGPVGQGVPVGGSTGQVLRKASGSDYDTEWAAAGSGSGSVTSVALTSTDLTISGSPITDSGTITANIAANAVTLEKLQTISSEHLLGRHGSGNGEVQTIGLGTGLAISGSNVRVATTGITAGTYTKLTIDETGRATVGATATPSDIGAQSLFETQNLTLTTDTELTASRAKQYNVIRLNSLTITLPTTGHLTGDIVVIYNIPAGSGTLTIRRGGASESFWTLTAAEQLRWRATGTGASDWELVRVDSHSADRITSGTLDIARIPTGTGSTQVALGDHTHAQLHDRSHAITSTSDHTAGNHKVFYSDGSGQVQELALGSSGTVLTSNGATSAPSFAAASGGVSAVNSTLADILSVSGSDLVADDLGSDKLYGFDDSEGKAIGFTIGSGLSVSGDTLSATGTIGGSTGSTDNLILRSDGTGSATLQNSALQLDDGTTSTQANVAIVNAHSETNSALVLTPKGTGAFIVGPKPDGTATGGGNARGADSVCIQPSGRSAATQVASGAQSVAIGYRSTASGSNSIAIRGNAGTADGIAIRGTTSGAGNNAIAIGASSTASNNVAVAIGLSAVASASGAIALGSSANSSGQNNAIAIGYLSAASAADAVAIGGESTTASGVRAVGLGSFVTASLRSQFATRPFASVYWGGQTTDATANVELNLDATATNRFTIAANTMVVADLMIAANQAGVASATAKAMFCRRMVAIRRDNANSTVLVGEVQTVGNDQFLNAPTWSILIDADDTNEALRVRVTGATSETVTWRVTAFYRVV